MLDNDPWGYYIYSVIKQGSINLAFESQRMAIPEAKFLGLRSIDFERCGLSEGVKIALNENDRKRARQVVEVPVVREEGQVATRDRADAEERLQTGSRGAHL